MKFERAWAMPNKYTFQIKPIEFWIVRHIPATGGIVIVDPFCGESVIADVRNDMRISGEDSLDWLKRIPSDSADILLFDPPYSPRQKKECYDDVGVHLSDTTSGYWAKLKDEIARIVKHGGIVMSFGWNSNGIGKSRGFQFKGDGLIVAHGGNHNDTICVCEEKQRTL